MNSLLWYVGRGLQMLGLLIAPYALYVGISQSDAKRELVLLLVAAVQFILGTFLISRSGTK